jgi:hypothetical protein
MNRGLAERCRCGHVFDPGSMVANKPALRCPLCGLVAGGGAAACDCGYDFTTRAVDVKPQLLRRRKYGWFWLAVGVLCVLAAGVLWLVVAIVPGFLLAIAGAGLIAKGLHAVGYTRRSLAELDARDKALPEARVIE